MENLSQKTRKLTTQTFTSFRHSCIAITSIINHLIEDCEFTYVLTSFLQNDPLEHHFGLYRMMSGAQYHISYCQILESERRMKLFSSHATTEQLSIDEFISSFSTPSEHQCFPTLDLEQLISSLQNYSLLLLHKHFKHLHLLLDTQFLLTIRNQTAVKPVYLF